MLEKKKTKERLLNFILIILVIGIGLFIYLKEKKPVLKDSNLPSIRSGQPAIPSNSTTVVNSTKKEATSSVKEPKKINQNTKLFMKGEDIQAPEITEETRKILGPPRNGE